MRLPTRHPVGKRLLKGGSAGRRARIIAVAVAGADLPVPPVDQQLTVLIAGDFPCRFDGLGLRVVKGGAALIASASNSPAIIGGNNVLIFTHGFWFFVVPQITATEAFTLPG